MRWYNKGYYILVVSILFGFIGWCSHAVILALFLYEKPFLDVFIFDLTLDVIIFRTIISIGFFIFAVFLADIFYKQKKSEKKLKKAHDKLNLINRELELRLREKTIEIEKLMNQKNALIIQLSHDLRTPLTPIMALLPIMLKQEKDPQQKEFINMTIRNVDYLRDIVSKIIDLTKLDTSVVDFIFEDIKLYNEVENIVKKKNFIFEKNNIDIENKISEDIFIKADRLKLTEIFDHILSNSVDFSEKDGGRITIDARTDNDFVTISVRDIGIGLDKKHLNLIFDEFYKADKSRHNHNHSGLGLSICKRIVEKHGGRIWAENPDDGKGTVLLFTLPLSQIY